MLTVKNAKGKNYVHALIKNLADVPGGVTVSSADLIPGTVLLEGTYVSVPDNSGICHVIKTAKVYEQAGSSATSYKVDKGSQFKVGDFISASASGAAYAITGIDTSEAGYDTITVGTTIGEAALGATLVQSTKSGSSGAVATVLGRTVEFYDVVANDNIFAPVVVIGTYKKALVPPCNTTIDGKLPGIVLL